MRNGARLWLLLAAVVALIFAALVAAEIQRDWSSAPNLQPVTLVLTPASALPLDSVSVAALDRRGARTGLPRVQEAWVAQDAFLSGLELTLPRDLADRIAGVTVSIGTHVFHVSAAELASGWSAPAPDSAHVVYASPGSLSAQRSRLPGLKEVINWGGDAAVLTRAVTAALWKTALCLLLLSLALIVVPFGRPVDAGTGGAARRVFLVCSLYAVVYGLVYFNLLHFNDTVDPKGDAWEYQAMAVATVEGHGLNRLGGIEPFATYRFRNAANDSTDYRAACAWWGGRFHPYRTPGYPAFLAGVYELCGIAPARAQQAQLGLLILTAAFLPFVGFAYWKSVGFYGGVIGGMIFFNSWYQRAGVFYTECLIMFVLLLFVLAFLLYEKRRTLPRAALLGAACGIALLVKGDLIFIPLLVLLYLAVQAWNKKIPAVQAAAFALLCAVTIAPWSLYASHMSGQFILLSTQGSDVLPEGNNEAVLADGVWHPEYAADPQAFYNRPEVRQLPVAARVLRFYLAHPGDLPRMAAVKMTAAFGRFPYLRLAVFFLLLRLLDLIRTAGPPPPTRGPQTGRHMLRRSAETAAAFFAVALSIPLMFLVLAGALLYAWNKGALRQLVFPASFTILLANFVLITLVVFGDRRFISVIDAFFILTALRFLLSFLVRTLGPQEPALAPVWTARIHAPLGP